MDTDWLTTSTPDGRRVVVWRSSDDDYVPGRVAVLAPGFGHDMRRLGPIAGYLVANGFTCYRFDSVDHVGLSDGDIRRFSLSGHYASLAATVDLAAREASSVVVVAASLAARTALRLGRSDDRVHAVLGLVGVVNARRTLEKALGEDFAARTFDELPDVVDFSGLEIDPRPLWLDDQQHDWGSLAGTIGDLLAYGGTVANFVGSSDEWVDAAEVREAFARGAGGPRLVVELPYGEHELSRNPVALQAMLRRLTRAALDVDRLDGTLAEPSFEELMTIRLAEREMAHGRS